MQSPKRQEDDEILKPAASMEGIAYGPVQSRRLGASLGINLLGAEKKICNFNCPYCELGFTSIKVSQIKKLDVFPSVQAVDDSLRKKVVQLTGSGVGIDYITFSGNGEPTLHPDFLEVVGLVKTARDQLIPQTKLTILTNGSTLNDNQIVRAMNLLDERMVKLDAGNDDILSKVEAPLTRTNVSRLIQGAKSLKDVIIQAMFVQGEVDNTEPDHLDDWIEAIGLIKPKQVHIYSLDREPAMQGLRVVARQRLKEISVLLEKRTKITASIFS